MFDCPNCAHSNCIEVKIKRTQGHAYLSCRVCPAKYEQKINPLMKEVNVFCNWKDRLEADAEMARNGTGLGLQEKGPEPKEEAEEDTYTPNLKVDARSKGIKKEPKQ